MSYRTRDCDIWPVSNQIDFLNISGRLRNIMGISRRWGNLLETIIRKLVPTVELAKFDFHILSHERVCFCNLAKHCQFLFKNFATSICLKLLTMEEQEIFSPTSSFIKQNRNKEYFSMRLNIPSFRLWGANFYYDSCATA